MAVNLTPQYHEAEDRYRRAKTVPERLVCLEQMWIELPKHKASEKLQADLKSKLSHARDELENTFVGVKKARGLSSKVIRQGAGQILLIGPPNSGKSQALAALTDANPEIAPYPFTTRLPQAGMMFWEEVRVQLIDTPPITSEVLDPGVLSLIRQSDACALFIDLADDDGIFQTLAVIEKLAENKTHIVGVLPEGIEDWTLVFVRTIIVGTKGNSEGAAQRAEVVKSLLPDGFKFFICDCTTGLFLSEIKTAFWKVLEMVRVYPKKPGKASSKEDVISLGEGSTVQDMAGAIHEELREKVKAARLWGPSAKIDGSVVSKHHILNDCDTVELQA